MSDSRILIAQMILNKTCVLVTSAFVLTLAPGFRSGRSRLSFRDREAALLVFLALGLVEELTVRQTVFDQRIVAVCAAGLLSGPTVGLVVAGFVTWLAVAYDGYPFPMVGISTLAAALIGGRLRVRRPGAAPNPLTGFCLAAVVTLLRDGLTIFGAWSLIRRQSRWDI